MILELTAALDRHRRTVVVAAAVAAPVSVAGFVHTSLDAAVLSFVGILLLISVLAVLLLLESRSGIADLVVGDGAFRTPPGAVPLFAGLLHITAIALLATIAAQSRPHGPDLIGWAITLALFACPLVLYVRGVWRGLTVTLTPAGVHAAKPAGTLFVPWAALATHQHRRPPGENDVRLVYARPELVVTTGRPVGRRAVAFDGSPAVLRAAIRHYAAFPADRAAIGSAAGYERLRTQAGLDRLVARQAPDPVRRTVLLAAAGTATILGGGAWSVGVDLLFHGRWWSLLAQASVLTASIGLRLIGDAVAGRRGRQGVPEKADGPAAPQVPAAAARPAWARDVTGL